MKQIQQFNVTNSPNQHSKESFSHSEGNFFPQIYCLNNNNSARNCSRSFNTPFGNLQRNETYNIVNPAIHKAYKSRSTSVMDKVSDFGHKKIEIEVDQDKFKDYGLNTINKLGERKNNSKDLNNTQKDNLDTMVDYNNPDDLIVSYVDQDIVGVNNTINNSELNINNK